MPPATRRSVAELGLADGPARWSPPTGLTPRKVRQGQRAPCPSRPSAVRQPHSERSPPQSPPAAPLLEEGPRWLVTRQRSKLWAAPHPLPTLPWEKPLTQLGDEASLIFPPWPTLSGSSEWRQGTLGQRRESRASPAPRSCPQDPRLLGDTLCVPGQESAPLTGV